MRTSRMNPPREVPICATRTATSPGRLRYLVAARCGEYSLGGSERASAFLCSSVIGTTPSPTPMEDCRPNFLSSSPDVEVGDGGAVVATLAATRAPLPAPFARGPPGEMRDVEHPWPWASATRPEGDAARCHGAGVAPTRTPETANTLAISR